MSLVICMFLIGVLVSLKKKNLTKALISLLPYLTLLFLSTDKANFTCFQIGFSNHSANFGLLYEEFPQISFNQIISGSDIKRI